MPERSDSTPPSAGTPVVPGVWVSIFVGDEHPLLRLKATLDWAAIQAEMSTHWRAAGKNVDGRPGRPWPVQLYAPLLVLMWFKTYSSRHMEEYISESVVARRFLDLPDGALAQVRDHSAIARAEAALGAEGKAAVNVLVLKTAEQLAFTDRQTLSADTTVQEPAIGYPNEPGILRGWAERIERALKKLKGRGVKAAQAGLAQAKEIYRGVKHHHLFAKTKAEKQQVLTELVAHSEALSELAQAISQQVSTRCGRVKQRAAATLQQLVEVAHLAATDPAMAEDGESGDREDYSPGYFGRAGDPQRPRPREIWHEVAHQPFGRWLSVWGADRRAGRREQDAGGSLAGVSPRVRGPATPKLLVYDRGASLTGVAPRLKQAGVKQVGIPPRGQGAWQVGKQARQTVKSERGKTEGSIGRLKRTKYGFSHRQERSLATQDAAGQRAIVSANLNTLLRDLLA